MTPLVAPAQGPSAPIAAPLSQLPVAVVGAGPVGLAAAAHLVQRGLTPLVLEQGAAVAQAMREWAHVRVFSPWRYNLDAAAMVLLAETGWTVPDPEALPTGGDIVSRYLDPLARHPRIAPHVRTGATVLGIARQGVGKTVTDGRELMPFNVRWRDGTGAEHELLAQAVIDASGTWLQPNPMGVAGHWVPGERQAADRIAYGIPNVLGAARTDYAGQHVLVVGAGHSAINVVLDLLRLQPSAPGTQVSWALRSGRVEKLIGGGAADKLAARGALGLAVKDLLAKDQVRLLAPFAATRVEPTTSGLRVTGMLNGVEHRLDVDRIVVATGFRPDVTLARELRMALDPILEAPPALAPLIDPNLHSCGTVPPHGVVELAHPEPGFFIV
ncbi:MAG TPA: FAD-dependent oxidoreductase, partial [bacterium]